MSKGPSLHAELGLTGSRAHGETRAEVAVPSFSTGLISFEEFHQTWKLFSSHMNIELTDDGINDLVRSIDFNKDGNIDFNEFLEAFRLVKQSQ